MNQTSMQKLGIISTEAEVANCEIEKTASRVFRILSSLDAGEKPHDFRFTGLAAIYASEIVRSWLSNNAKIKICTQTESDLCIYDLGSMQVRFAFSPDYLPALKVNFDI